jgi:CheY-like chemotaxis protein
MLEADFARISQIFSNILNNAAKYTDNGGIINISAEEMGDAVIITVSDNGIGVSAEMLPSIFEMFAQVDSSLERTQGGLGIGLTLVKKLVEMHGGSIEARSEGLHLGSRFSIKLPIALNKDINITKNEETMKENHTASLRVLVVDDNEASAKTLGWMLELSGHEIRLAHDGKSALEIARNYKPSVVLLDIGLPGMNGYEVCKTMKLEPSLKDTVYIAQTGWSQEEHIQRSKEAGFNHHLIKPIDMKELQDLLVKPI